MHQHIASTHPKVLHDFELGWTKLGKALQEKWLAKGRREVGDLPFIYGQDDPDTIYFSPVIFNGWAEIASNALVRQNITKPLDLSSNFQTIRDLIIEGLSRSDSILGVPKLPGFGDDRSETRKIATVAAGAVIDAGLRKTTERFKENIEVNGLDAVYKYLIDPLVFEER